MSTSHLTRRLALVAGTTLAAASAVNVAAIATVVEAAEPDPIFEAIAAHKNAYMNRMRVGRTYGRAPVEDPRYEEMEEADEVASATCTAVEDDLVETMPTTMAGVIALLSYIEDFCHQKIALPEDPTQWHSTSDVWLGDGGWQDETILDRFNDKPVAFPTGFWLMRNALAALRELAVRS